MLSLIMNPGLPEEETFDLAHATSFTIGRTRDNAVCCLHKSLSRTHAQLDFDGTNVTITDLQSKNGVFVEERRVARCELHEGDSFRCGDVGFLLSRVGAHGSATTAPPGPRPPIPRQQLNQTMPSPLALGHPRQPSGRPESPVTVADDPRYKDKLFVLVRASELAVNDLPLERLLEELVALAVQVVDVDRIVVLTRDDAHGELSPAVVKTFVAPSRFPYSTRVVDWVVDHRSATSFEDVSRDKTLLGDALDDDDIRAAMCVPMNPGTGLVGVLYADNVSRPETFRPDDVAFFRALGNLAALAIEAAALRESLGIESVPMTRP